jgi:hypothetical protein
MSNGWRRIADVKGVSTLSDGTVRHGHPLVLPQVFSPGCDDEGLNVTARIGDVAIYAPADGTVTSTDYS